MQQQFPESTRPSCVFAAILIIAAAAGLRAENWPHWRGPHFDGSTTEQGLPVEFSRTNNVRWVADLPGPSAATPIVWNNRVFLSSLDSKSKTLHAIALDRKAGKELWNHEIAPAYSEGVRSSLASPSPTTDGKLVYFYYGTSDLVAFDFDGKKIWSRNIQNDYGQFAYMWVYSSSPTLYDGKLYIQVLQRDVPVHGRGRKDGPIDSFLLALDPQTGKELWKHVRPSDAHGESHEAYSTPIPFEFAGRRELLVTGGDCITGHDAATGAELWRWGTWNPERVTHWRLVPSPVAGGGVVLACAPKGSPVYAFKAGAKGTLKDSDLAWISQEREISSDVCTPLFYRGRFYVLDGDRRTIARVNPATGKPDWIGELGTRAKIESSPTGADGKIYFQDFCGNVFIVDAGEQFKLLRTIPMAEAGEDTLRSTIAVSQGNLFLRTGSKLYCVGR
jgi:outer membrane protein assembly factor BamB